MELCEGKYGGKVERLQRGAHGDLFVIVGVTSLRAPRSSVFMCSAAHVNSGDLFVFDHRGLWNIVRPMVWSALVEGSKVVCVYVFRCSRGWRRPLCVLLLDIEVVGVTSWRAPSLYVSTGSAARRR